MRRPAPIGDENGPAAGRLLGAAGVLIELAARQSGDQMSSSLMIVVMLLH
jgi:hypothetical protein